MITGYPETKIPGEASMTAQPTPAVPYNTPQSPVQQPQATNIQQPAVLGGMQMPTTYAYPVTPETQMRISRSVGAEVAGRVVAAWITKEGISFDINGKLLEIADMMSMWILSGTTNAAEPQVDTSQVCSSCQLLKVDCTCPTEDFIR